MHVEEMPGGILGEQDCSPVPGNSVHRTVAVISSFYPVSRDLQPWASPSSGPSPALPQQHTASCEDGRPAKFPLLALPSSFPTVSEAAPMVRPHTLFPLFLIRNHWFSPSGSASYWLALPSSTEICSHRCLL